MSDIEANSGIGLQYTVQPVAQAEWSDAVKVSMYSVIVIVVVGKYMCRCACIEHQRACVAYTTPHSCIPPT